MVNTSGARRKAGLRHAHPASSDSRDNIHQLPPQPRGPARLSGQRRGRSGAVVESDLLDLHGGPGALQLRLDLGRVVLGHSLLDRLWRRLDQILGLLQAQAGDRADLLDDVDLLGAKRRQDHVELGLLLGNLGRRRRGAAAGRHRHGGRGRHAPLLLEQLRQLRCLEDGQARQILDQLIQIRHTTTPATNSSDTAPPRRTPPDLRAGYSPSFSARAAKARATCPPGACNRPTSRLAGAFSRPISLPRSASSDGSSAKARTDAASSSVPLRPPPTTFSFSFFLPYSLTIFGAAVGSLENAIAVGPSNRCEIGANEVPSTARCASLFLVTRNDAPAARIRTRRSEISATVRPLK